MQQWIVKAGASSLDQLVLVESPLLEPGPGEVRIRIRAVSLNRRDLLLLHGTFGAANEDFVAVSDGAGEIDAVGEGVESLAVGDRVVGYYYPSWQDGPPADGQGWGLGSPGQNGMLTQYAILPAIRVLRFPSSLSFEEAACLPCAALTAWTALNGDRPYRRPLQAGEKVLVLGTGGVSLFAALLAKARGAEVYATTGDDSKIGRLEALGISGVINYRTTPAWGEAAVAAYGGFDRVINAVGSESFDQAIAAAGAGAEIALMGLFQFAEQAPNFIPVMMRGISIRGISVGSRAAFQDLLEVSADLDINSVIGKRFALQDAKAAYEAAHGGSVFGKVIITMSE